MHCTHPIYLRICNLLIQESHIKVTYSLQGLRLGINIFQMVNSGLNTNCKINWGSYGKKYVIHYIHRELLVGVEYSAISYM